MTSGGHRVDVSGWQPLTESDVYEQVAHANDSSAHSSSRCCRAIPRAVLAAWISALQSTKLDSMNNLTADPPVPTV